LPAGKVYEHKNRYLPSGNYIPDNFFFRRGATAEESSPDRISCGERGDQKPWVYVEAFCQGLRNLGHIERKDILVDYRYSEEKEDRFTSLIAELVQLKVDVLVVAPLINLTAAKQIGLTIPQWVLLMRASRVIR
jgi:hypothetical protein